MSTQFQTSQPLTVPEFMDAAQMPLPTLPERFSITPWPQMPQKMLIAIDGWSHTQKLFVGAWVTEAVGGLFVDSNKVYRSIVAAATKAGVDMNVYHRVASWCEQAAVDIGFTKANALAYEAQVAVNGSWISSGDLASVTEASLRAASDEVWDKVRQAMCQCDFNDRVVIVGNSVGHEFPKTPYKFFLDDTTRNPADSLDRAAAARPWAGDRSNYTNGPTYFNRLDNTLMIDTTRCSGADQVMMVLVESVARAFEMGYLRGPFDKIFRDARDMGDAVRRRIEREVGRNSK